MRRGPLLSTLTLRSTRSARPTLVLALVIAIVALTMASEPVGAARDDRVLVPPNKLTKRPFRSIVLVTVGRKVVCTGFVVGARKVVTAAHCLTRDPAQGDYRFRRGLPDTIRLHRAYSGVAGRATFPSCRVARVWAHPRFIRSGVGDARVGSRAHDYAVLTTVAGCRYPRDARMRLWSTSADGAELRASQAIRIAGYPSDSRFAGMNGLNLWRTRGSLVDASDRAMLEFTGFVAQGMSGGPLWRSFRRDSPCGRRQCVVAIATECSINGNGLCRLGDSVRRAVRVTPIVKAVIKRH